MPFINNNNNNKMEDEDEDDFFAPRAVPILFGASLRETEEDRKIHKQLCKEVGKEEEEEEERPRRRKRVSSSNLYTEDELMSGTSKMKQKKHLQVHGNRHSLVESSS